MAMKNPAPPPQGSDRAADTRDAARDAAHEADLARMRRALADIAYRLGLHENSAVRELGALQVDALRSLRGLLAVPRRLLGVARRFRRGAAPGHIPGEQLEAMAEAAFATYAREGFVAADVEISSLYLTVEQRARVYTELAKRVFPLGPRDACRFGHIADSLEPQPFRTLWLAFLKFDAGELDEALATLERLPPDHPLSDEEREKAAQLRGLVRLRHRLPVVPPRAPAAARDREGVLYVAASALPNHVSGYTLRTQALLQALRGKGLQVACLTRPGYPADRPDRGPGPLDPVNVDGIDYLRAPGSRQLSPPDEYISRAAAAIEEVLRERRVAVVHAASNYENALPALIAARRCGLPFVYEVRGLWEYTAASRLPGYEQEQRFALERDLETLVARQADHVLAINEELAAELRQRGVPAERISLAPNAAYPDERPLPDPDLRRVLGLPEQAFVVGFAGSMTRYEGLDDLLRALAIVADEVPQLHVLLVGGGESKAELEALARELGLEARVHFAGRVEPARVRDYLALCDCVALPRKPVRVCELVTPLKPLEAMAMGLPLVVSNVAPLRRLVEDGSTGRIHAAGDPDALARCLADLAAQPDLARRMGEAARRKLLAERGWDRVADEVAVVYRILRDQSATEGAGAPAAMPGPRSGFSDGLRALRVAAVMDEFTQACFEPECQLTPLGIDTWKAQMDACQPHLLLVESAWKGYRGEWEKKVPQCSNELHELVAYCRARGIPTAFWNKEDPVHYALFLRAASLFDVVFTTDMDRIKAYREDLGHSRVHLLPFAAQPRVHNPIERYPRKDAFCFAGSYYAKYPERRADFDMLVDAALAFRPVDIFDRNHGSGDPGLGFPERYQPMIRGSLPFAEIDRAYKGYRYAITINTVKQSQSMFARRAFELLACNTLTISNYSRGLRTMLGELVPSAGDAGPLRERLADLLSDEQRLRRFRLAGLRKVLSEHTYAHRLAWLAGRTLGERLQADRAHVLALAHVADQAEVEAALRVFDAQRWPEKRLVLVAAEGFVPEIPSGRRDLSLVGAAQARTLAPAAAWPGCWLARLDGRDHYGPNYLTDLALGTAYAKADALAKRSHYRLVSGLPVLSEDGAQYRPAAAAPLRQALVRCEALAGRVLAELLDGDAPVGDLEILATDEFNYCRDGAGAEVAAVVDDLPLDTGLAMDALLERGEARFAGDAPAGNRADRDEAELAFLRALFPPSSHAEGRLHVRHSGDRVLVSSRLDDGKHGYVYARRQFRPEELAEDGVARFHLRTSAGLYVNVALVFMDANRERLSHAIVSSDVNQAIPLPPGTEWIKLGLRVIGAGDTELLALVRGAVSPALEQIAGRGQALLLTKDYPRYDNLYRYGFVHRRVLAYGVAGTRVDVFRFSNQPLEFSEFQGVDVVAGQAEHLDLLVSGNDYRCLLVHAMDPQMWEAVKPLLNRIRVVVWVHGAEIQPWYRRSFNFPTTQEQERARQGWERRRAMWMEVLAHPHPNLRLVFVSRHLAHEALRDLGVQVPPAQLAVIPNFVDGELFRYRPKTAEHRLRILSIRPFASAAYGNDLGVAAILELSREPFFGELSFHLIGDGPLFEQTVAPLRDFPNVRLEQRFLSQQEIAALHADYGIFLVPSRMDSQGVSRDEAMASGLVPVTNRVAAIPEFVDEGCAWLAGPEDARGLAEGIRTLYRDPDRFLAMSAAAAAQARRLSGHEATIARELVLIAGGTLPPLIPEPTPVRRRLALYGDVNLNVTDGSAVWAASLAQVLAGQPGVHVTLYLKARVRSPHLIAPLLSIESLRLAEPDIEAHQALTPDEALDRIEADDIRWRHDAVVLRGFELCHRAARRPSLAGRLWVYITDLPQRAEDVSGDLLARLRDIATAASVLLCQTPQFRDYLERLLPEARGKTRLLPPMIPELAATPLAAPPAADAAAGGDRPLRLAYAGKFAPLWGIRELFAAHRRLREEGLALELHAWGDKIHNPPEDPAFRDEVRTALRELPDLHWHGASEREALLRELAGMDVGWAWRHPSLEAHTHELSTKVLEYALCGVPPILAGNAVNREVFGEAYPLYADSEAEALALLRRLAREPALRREARQRVREVAKRFTFEAVRRSLVAQGLLPGGSGEA